MLKPVWILICSKCGSKPKIRERLFITCSDNLKIVARSFLFLCFLDTGLLFFWVGSESVIIYIFVLFVEEIYVVLKIQRLRETHIKIHLTNWVKACECTKKWFDLYVIGCLCPPKADNYRIFMMCDESAGSWENLMWTFFLVRRHRRNQHYETCYGTSFPKWR